MSADQFVGAGPRPWKFSYTEGLMTTTHSSPPSTHHLRILYIASLCALAVLAASGHAVIQTVLVRWLPDTKVINIAGRQRMFSQQLSKGALFIQVDVNPSARQQRVEELRSALALWERSHLGLQRGDAELTLSFFVATILAHEQDFLDDCSKV